jgi:signal transduction histidine kinase
VRSELTLRNGKILADRDAVVAALENIIANSLEYSKRGSGINVRTFSSYDMLAVSVKDSGIGIPENEMPKIFEPFFRGSSGASVRPGGTGLGLPVVKGVVEAHKGRIEIESEPGNGTCVTLFFPRMEER